MKTEIYLKIRRLIEIISTLILMIIFFPLIIIIPLYIIIFSGQNPIIIQKRRITKNFKKISLVKFRTLNCEDSESVSSDVNILYKSYLRKNVTKIGKFLRKTGLDEIPQLFQVLTGKVSLIGPRPLIEVDLTSLKKFYPGYYKLRSKIFDKPGITGYWQAFGKRELGIEELVRCDLYYQKNKGVILDFKIIFKTILIVMFGIHSDSILNTNRKIKILFKSILEN